MKPSPFTYHAPTSVAEALETLAGLGPDGKVLAGGQSLVPLLSMRLAAPAHLVDINRLAGELGGVRADADGVRVGALARHAEVEADERAYTQVPLLRQALRLVAHPVIRHRGTTVGSLVHADPSGEMPAVLALLGGTVEVARHGEATRTVGADDFFVGPLESAVGAGELAVAAYFPRPRGRVGTSFVEVARRNGDYAVCGVAALVRLDADGDQATVQDARAAYVSVGATPVLLDLTEAVVGSRAVADSPAWQDAGALARARIDPEADIHASAQYRAHLADVLTRRALAEAVQRASRAAADEGTPVR